MHRSKAKIMQVFAKYFRRKYESLIVDEASIAAMARVAIPAPPTDIWRDTGRPIDVEEIRNALRVEGRNKATGSDGMGLQFYKANWTTLKDDLCTVTNQMYTEKAIATK